MLHWLTRRRRFRIGFIEAQGRDVRSYGLPLAFGYLMSFVARAWPREVECFVAADVDDLLSRRPELVGITSVSSTFNHARAIAAAVKESAGVPVVIGGQHITALWQTLSETMDVAVLGEGERTFLELVALARSGGLDPRGLARIAGIAYRQDGKVRRTEPRQVIGNLDILPFPERAVNPRDPHEAIMMTSRGCPYDCIFCSSCRYWGGFRAFSSQYVLDELDHIRRTMHRIETIYLLDDLFVARRRRLERIVAGIHDRRLDRDFRFHGFVRANLVDDGLCELLKRMGMRSVRFGAESGSDRILAAIKAGPVTVADNQRAIDLLHQHGLAPRAAFMVGIPGETEADLRATFDFIARNRERMRVDGFYLMVPLPGTPVWDDAVGRGLVGEDMDWSRLNLDFKSPDFDWANFLYLNEEGIPRARFLAILRESGLVEAPT